MRERMDTFLKVIKNPRIRNLLLVPEPRGSIDRNENVNYKSLHHSINVQLQKPLMKVRINKTECFRNRCDHRISK